MNANFKPTYVFNRIEDIPLEIFEKENIKGIFLDVDNTILDRTKIIETLVRNYMNDIKWNI